jgi:hypothetical protein
MKCSLVPRIDVGKSCCKWRREPMGIRSSSHTSTNRLRRSPTAKRSLASDVGAQAQLTVRGARAAVSRSGRLASAASLGSHGAPSTAQYDRDHNAGTLDAAADCEFVDERAKHSPAFAMRPLLHVAPPGSANAMPCSRRPPPSARTPPPGAVLSARAAGNVRDWRRHAASERLTSNWTSWA